MSKIRVLAICIFRRGPEILVAEGRDSVDQESFLRPLGGAVEFGERAEEALRREIREELHAEIAEPVQLGVIENLFTYQRQPGHEIVLVFDARFVIQQVYENDSVPIHERGIWHGPARWVDLRSDPPLPVYPAGLIDFLQHAE